MTNLGLSDLSSIHVIGQYGNDLTPLIWLTVTATFMYVGPATVSLIYLLFYDRPRAGEESQLTRVDAEEQKFEQLKAA